MTSCMSISNDISGAREIFGKEYAFKEIKDFHKPMALQTATWVQSGVVLDALGHACNSLDN